MKRLLLMIIIIAVLSFSSVNGVPVIINYHPLDINISGNIYEDFASQEYNMTGQTNWAHESNPSNCKIGQCSFSSLMNISSVNYPYTGGAAIRGIDFWFNAGNRTSTHYPLTMTTKTWGQSQIAAQHVSASWQPTSYMYENSNTISVGGACNDTIEVNTWQHIAYTFGSNGFSIYIDGVRCYYDSGATSTPHSDMSYITYMARDWGGNEATLGWIDNVAVWGTDQPTPDQVADMYNSGNGRNYSEFDFSVTPVQLYVNILNPTNNSNISVSDSTYNLQVQFNATTTQNVTDCQLSENGVSVNLTTGYDTENNSIFNISKTFTGQLNYSGYNYSVVCNDGLNVTFSDNFTYNILIDDIFPLIDVRSPTNGSYWVDLLNSTTYFYDDNLYNVSTTLYYPNGSVAFSNATTTTDTNVSLVSYIDTSTYPNGDYVHQSRACDGHTAHDIDFSEWAITKRDSDKKIDFGNCAVYPDESNKISSFDYACQGDRCSWTYDYTNIENTRNFFLECDNPIDYLQDSEYESHFISGNNWIDFENTNGYDTTVQILTVNRYKITFTGTDISSITTQSIGELNCNELNYTITLADTVIEITTENSTGTYKTDFDEAEEFLAEIRFNYTDGTVINDSTCELTLYNASQVVTSLIPAFTICSGPSCDYEDIFSENVTFENSTNAIGDSFHFYVCHEGLSSDTVTLTGGCNGIAVSFNLTSASIPSCDIGTARIKTEPSIVCENYTDAYINITTESSYANRISISDLHYDRQYSEHTDTADYNATEGYYQMHSLYKYDTVGVYNVTGTCTGYGYESTYVHNITVGNLLPVIIIDSIVNGAGTFSVNTNNSLVEYYDGVWTLDIIVIDSDLDTVQVNGSYNNGTVFFSGNDIDSLIASSIFFSDDSLSPYTITVLANDSSGNYTLESTTFFVIPQTVDNILETGTCPETTTGMIPLILIIFVGMFMLIFAFITKAGIFGTLGGLTMVGGGFVLVGCTLIGGVCLMGFGLVTLLWSIFILPRV